MADLLPLDTTSPAIAGLTCPPDGRYTPSVDELVRQAAAARELAEHAAKRKLAPGAYVQRGLDIEWHHELDDPAVPYSPYLQLGGKA
ncbi:hypothetical protein OHA37_26755 [Streptomyces sp. NBC_00335]|uniref:hypothetical protein n=1 Tax=unclassified Streptomyces TaxID=2593676 RepID=UPI00225A5BCD|nr:MULTISPECIES: hypothetical protein [unclassified Streptomyces]MCX5407450.1 hypothetical protein [Streptomyces sp. NBC_00086]